MNKLDTLYELLEKSCHDIIQSEELWLSFLKTSGYLYNFNFTNQLLIYQQDLMQKPVRTLKHGIIG